MSDDRIRHPYIDLGLIALAVVVVFTGAFMLGRGSVDVSYPEDFLVVHSVEIQNTPFGMDPLMSIDREIVQAFAGNWVATIRPADTLEYACGNAGSAPYRPDAQIPEAPYLFDFWLFDRGNGASLCREGFYPLPRGCYIVDTTWEFVDPLSLTTLSVHNRSNEFCIE